LDDQHWDQSWAEGGDLMKSHTTKTQWTSSVQSARQALGVPSSRVVQTVTKAKTLPGAPAGEYEVFQFLTNFAQKQGAIETVTVSYEGASWKVEGYFIR
jgi:hypothetical protein